MMGAMTESERTFERVLSVARAAGVTRWKVDFDNGEWVLTLHYDGESSMEVNLTPEGSLNVTEYPSKYGEYDMSPEWTEGPDPHLQATARGRRRGESLT